MFTVVLVIHLLLAFGLVGTVLIQRSEGGGLGIGGSSGGGGGGGMGGFMSGRASANLLTRTTGILAAGFFTTSIVLALMSNAQRDPGSILDQTAPAAIDAPQTPAEPTAPLAN